MIPTWDGRALVREAIRNTTSRPARNILLVLLVAGMLTSVSFLELDSARRVEAAIRTLKSQGSTTLVIRTSDSAAALPAQDCARLNGQVGVIAAVGVGTSYTSYAGTSPGLGFSEATSIGNPIGALTGKTSVETLGPGLIMSTELASQLGVVVGSYVSIGGHVIRVVGVENLGQRDETLGRIALAPKAPTGDVATCYVELTDGAFTSGLSVMGSAFHTNRALVVQSVLPRGPGIVVPSSMWASRSSRFLWVPGGLLVGVLYLFAARGRRHEYAVYLLSGSHRSAVAVLYLLELQIVFAGALVVSVAWLSFVSALLHTPWEGYHAGLVGLARAYLVGTILAPLGLLWLVRTNLTGILRERIS